jgi:hypothetical protein
MCQCYTMITWQGMLYSIMILVLLTCYNSKSFLLVVTFSLASLSFKFAKILKDIKLKF